MNTIKFGVIGLGRIGRIHLRNLVTRIPEAEVIIAADPSPEGKAFAEQWHVPRITDSYEEMLQLDELDAVALCSPTETHAPYTMAFARAGKHIFCEKPLDTSLDKIREVKAVLDETGITFMLAFNRRFDRNFSKIKRLVDEGTVGEPHILNITSRDPAPPPIQFVKESGGLFMDMTIHDLDMARFLLGKEVEEVYALGRVKVDPAIGEAGDIDTAALTLQFEGGAIALINNSRQSNYGYDQRTEVFGSKGMVKIENLREDTHEVWSPEGASGPLLLDFFLERYEDAYFREMQAFVACLKENTPSPVGAYDGLMSTAIALAAQKSMAENRPVRIEEVL